MSVMMNQRCYDVGAGYSRSMPNDAYAREEAALLALLRFVDEPQTVSSLRHRFDEGKKPSDILAGRAADELFSLVETDEILERTKSEISGWRSQGIEIVTPFSRNYPAQLRTVFDYPLFLFAKGTVMDDLHSAAIVGSRAVTPRGIKFASDLAGMLAQDHITVVSGLARGVDGAAHRGALDAGGRTVALIGTGIGKYYPPEHRDLHDEVARKGLLLSQFWPGSGASRQSFPMRNITMSAYSSITVIAEASENSGTRIQARAAIKHARPLVITEEIADGTTWGAKFAGGGYDVTVVASPEEARTAIRQILFRQDQMAESFGTTRNAL
ncbi:DNA-processing protein DprA [Cryobacterium sp. PAMC25264]|uniref:DNA-processing protein DprA n=1 Tax=Cryobacterium sp. PAMC25264 TaxID=2861288 RepID=UPI001C629B13|nr:DNA-processing protein DprA [Cryobacterium sp. PAMC25264]QYF74749.1 DNA-protecting protein DprA [Cryobacterium sp. PAMC25264]